ncbi:MAG: hypothetical protein F4X02_06950 [Chloroflexi bacterium]|nr:hypothetical protein [Chloroflexota bacterium]
MATVAAPPPKQSNPRALSFDGLVTIVGAVTLMLTIKFFNQNLGDNINSVRTELKADIADVRTELKADIFRLESDIEAVRTELKADIENVRMELSADINRLEADIQRLDDRLFAVIVPPTPAEDGEATL